MTSASLSLSDRLKNHKKYISRTLWSSYVGFVLMIIYYVICTMLMVTRSVNYAKMYGQTQEVLKHEKCNAVLRILGFEQFGWVLVGAIAIAFAFQGFSYLFDQRKIDFYLSQPTTIAERLRKNYFNAITTFIIMYVVSNAVALLVAALMGAINGIVIVTVLIETIRSIVFFFTIYCITVLSILLCGSLPIAVLVLAFFFVISMMFGFEINGFKEMFYSTYYSNHDGYAIMGSPVYDRFSTFRLMSNLKNMTWYNSSFDSIRMSLGYIKDKDIDILIVGIIAFIFVLIFSRFRKAEHAGKTIIYKPFRYFLKIVLCIVIGLAGGMILYMIYSDVLSGNVYAIMLVAMLVSAALAGCVIEAFLDGNIRSVLNGKAQTIMALAVLALIFILFKGDLLGYDSYIPDIAKVESCAILENGFDYYLYIDGENKFTDMSEENMHITDIASFNEIVKAGLETQKVYQKAQKEGHYKDLGWSCSVVYRLKNGKKVYRTICIPYDIDSSKLSRIIDSDEYKNGYFTVFHDDAMRKFDNENRQSSTVRYITVNGNMLSGEISYSELSDAYKKDVEEKFSFEYVKNTQPIGRIEYSNSSYKGSGNCDFNVFETYSNTIALLKKYGIYTDGVLDVDKNVKSITVTNFYPGYKLDEINDKELTSTYENTKEITYTEPVKIKEILSNANCSEFYSRWYVPSFNSDTQFLIEVKTINARDSYGADSVYYRFEMGKVPEYIYTDTN